MSKLIIKAHPASSSFQKIGIVASLSVYRNNDLTLTIDIQKDGHHDLCIYAGIPGLHVRESGYGVIYKLAQLLGYSTERTDGEFAQAAELHWFMCHKHTAERAA